MTEDSQPSREAAGGGEGSAGEDMAGGWRAAAVQGRGILLMPGQSPVVVTFCPTHSCGLVLMESLVASVHTNTEHSTAAVMVACAPSAGEASTATTQQERLSLRLEARGSSSSYGRGSLSAALHWVGVGGLAQGCRPPPLCVRPKARLEGVSEGGDFPRGKTDRDRSVERVPRALCTPEESSQTGKPA